MTDGGTAASIHDEDGLIGKVVVLWIVVLLLLGLLLLDGLSIALTTFRLSSTAQTAATTAATTYKNDQRRDAANACAAAELDLLHDNVAVPGGDGWCKIDARTGDATIQLHATASSLVLGRTSFTKDFTRVSVKETAAPSSL